MKQQATVGNSLRRVGATEGVVHIVGAAALFMVLSRLGSEEVAVAVAPTAGVFWSGWYGALRAARVRDWFGAWDAISFSFVAAYAVGLSFAAHVALR